MALPADALITLDELKSYLNVSGNETRHDPILELLITAAKEGIEAWCGRTFAKAAIVNERHDGGVHFVFAKRVPIDESQAIALTIDPEGIATVVASDEFRVDAKSGKVVLFSSGFPYRRLEAGTPTNGSFPRGDRIVRLDYTGGYDPIPSSIKVACMITCAAWQAGRRLDPEAQTHSAGSSSKTRLAPTFNGPIPDAALKMLFPYRIIRAMAIVS